MNIITTTDIVHRPAACNIVEFQSSTIPRRVKSTLAAEGAALSTAIDRHLYLRLLIQAILHRETEYTSNWRAELVVPGICVTDAGSLYDHLHKTGSIPAERQVLIDLLTARDMIEEKIIDVRWCPTTHMVSDMLTKNMAPTRVQKLLYQDNEFSLRPNTDEVKQEEHRKTLRQNQRIRAKEKKKAREDASEKMAKEHMRSV